MVKFVKEVKVIDRITKDIKALFGKNLVSVVLFGSYATGKQKDNLLPE